MTRRLDSHTEADYEESSKLQVLEERMVTHRCHFGGGGNHAIGLRASGSDAVGQYERFWVSGS